VAVLAAAAVPSAAVAAKRTPQKVSLRLSGVSVRSEVACGATHRTAVVSAGTPVTASIRVANRRSGRRASVSARRRTLLVSERCRDGRWVRTARSALGRAPVRRGAVRRFRRALALSEPGDLRVRAALTGPRKRHPARSGFIYVRAVAADVTERAVSFHVVNRNGSRVPCDADGKAYDIHAQLVGPRSALDRDGGAVTVYLHQIGMGSWYWHFKAVPGYDYAGELARLGHVSLVIDEIGYGDSGRPEGTKSCYGSEADTASQIAKQLREGGYAASGGAAPRFGKVALGSNAAAGLMSQPAAYSFGNFDALVVTSWADQGFSTFLTRGAFEENAFCAGGGDTKDGQPGYVNTPMDASLVGPLYFADADPRVLQATTALRSPGPCGEPQSALATIGGDQAALREVKVPVLLVYGTKDAFFDDPRSAGDQQKGLYTGSRDVTATFIDGAGNALALERSAPRFRDIVSSWLAGRGF
jgi:pimeloyl-ACP methyl ester carboxylesterase